MISYQTCGDHLLKPFGLRLVIKVDTAHQIVSCYREEREDFLNGDTCTHRTTADLTNASTLILTTISLAILYIKYVVHKFSTRWCYY